jgi:hypothetical protein
LLSGFGAIADEYIANLKANDAAEITVSKNRWLLEDLAAPIRNRPVVSASQLAYMLDGIDWRNPRHTFRPERVG